MHVKFCTFCVLVAALMLSAGCESSPKADGDDAAAAGAPARATLAEPVAILGQRRGDQGDLPYAGIWLIRDQQDLARANSATIGALGVDLDAHDIVVVAMGSQPTGGYGIEITAIQQVGDTLYVQGSASAPAPDAAVTQAVTSPWTAAVIENTAASGVHLDVE